MPTQLDWMLNNNYPKRYLLALSKSHDNHPKSIYVFCFVLMLAYLFLHIFNLTSTRPTLYHIKHYLQQIHINSLSKTLTQVLPLLLYSIPKTFGNYKHDHQVNFGKTNGIHKLCSLYTSNLVNEHKKVKPRRTFSKT